MDSTQKTTIESSEIVAALTTATLDVFSTMLMIPIKACPSRQEPSEPEKFDGVVALVGIAGSWSGTGRISCCPSFACQLAGALLMSEYASVNEEVLDAVSEVANMIIGNVKTIFEEKLGPLALSVPTVIFGRNYQTRSSGILDWTVVPFKAGDHTMEVRFCLMPTRVAPHVQHRSDALQQA
jgi:chemotaxis protein CheX